VESQPIQGSAEICCGNGCKSCVLEDFPLYHNNYQAQMNIHQQLQVQMKQNSFDSSAFKVALDLQSSLRAAPSYAPT